MNDRPVSVERLRVIDSGSSESRYGAMRDQSARGRDFRRRVHGLWLRQQLRLPPEDESAIDVRDNVFVIATEALPAPRQAESA